MAEVNNTRNEGMKGTDEKEKADNTTSHPVPIILALVAHGAQRRDEPQPPENEPRRSPGAADLPARLQTEVRAAVGSGEKLCVVIVVI